ACSAHKQGRIDRSTACRSKRLETGAVLLYMPEEIGAPHPSVGGVQCKEVQTSAGTRPEQDPVELAIILEPRNDLQVGPQAVSVQAAPWPRRHSGPACFGRCGRRLRHGADACCHSIPAVRAPIDQCTLKLPLSPCHADRTSRPTPRWTSSSTRSAPA